MPKALKRTDPRLLKALSDPLGETPDHTLGIYLLSAFGYTEKLPVYEVAPWTVRYQASPADLTDGRYAAALADIIGRPRVVVDTMPSDWTPTTPVPVDIAKVLGAVLSKTNPVNVRLSDGTVDIPLPTTLDTGAFKIKEQSPLTTLAVTATHLDIRHLNATDDAVLVSANDLDIRDLTTTERTPLGSQGVALQQKATSNDLIVTLDGESVGAAVSNWPSDYPDADVLAQVQPATTISDLADVTAGNSATRLIVTSTPCKAVVIRALAANSSTVRVGSSTITSSRGAELSAGDAVVLAVDNVNLVYVIGNASDKVSVSYVN
jgi:hypothetical protein